MRLCGMGMDGCGPWRRWRLVVAPSVVALLRERPTRYGSGSESTLHKKAADAGRISGVEGLAKAKKLGWCQSTDRWELYDEWPGVSRRYNMVRSCVVGVVTAVIAGAAAAAAVREYAGEPWRGLSSKDRTSCYEQLPVTRVRTPPKRIYWKRNSSRWRISQGSEGQELQKWLSGKEWMQKRTQHSLSSPKTTC